jgi:hypothetical protein
VALQEVAHLVHPRRSFDANDVYCGGSWTAVAPPLVEWFGDAAVKPFVGRAGRFGDEPFRLPFRERHRDLLAVRPALVPIEQEPAAGVRMRHAGLLEEDGTVRRAVGQDERDVGRRLGERSHASTGRDDVRIHDDGVVARVPGR